ncbi:unnamed protein product [Paramecium primaurelia]|uniref:Uncharacterized protein n=1 Tax=Paramecium primaurelia TaxID=5886 RepID=A0A8S1KJ04_PARPR|nr:unnamed protein product [Paramecium primaurelia]
MILVNEINFKKKCDNFRNDKVGELYEMQQIIQRDAIFYYIDKRLIKSILKELNEQNSDNQNLRGYYIIKGTIELKIQNLIEKDSQQESKILIDQKMNSVDKYLNQIELWFKDEYIFLIHSTSDWIQNVKRSAFMSSLKGLLFLKEEKVRAPDEAEYWSIDIKIQNQQKIELLVQFLMAHQNKNESDLNFKFQIGL